MQTTTYQYTQSYPVTLDSTSLVTPEVFIDLTNKQRSAIVKLVSLRENSFFAGIVDKVNKRQSVQRRILMITDKALYNIDHDVSFFETITLCRSFDGYRIRRKININNIYGATICVNPASTKGQVLIHVKDEYDYLYNGGQQRDKIVKSLMNAHFATTKNIPFELYCRDETNLSKFHTTDSDLKDKVDKRPKDGKILVTREMMQSGLEWIIYNRNTFISGSSPTNSGSNTSHNPSQGQGGNSPNAGPNNGPSGHPNVPGPNGTVQPNQAQPGLGANVNPFQQVRAQNQPQNQMTFAPPGNQPRQSNTNFGADPNAYSNGYGHGNAGGQNPQAAPNNSGPNNQFIQIYPSFDNYPGGQWS